MIQCAGCGSNLVYDIARKKMYCKACGNEYEPESVDKDEDSEERKHMELTVFICPQYGTGCLDNRQGDALSVLP